MQGSYRRSWLYASHVEGSLSKWFREGTALAALRLMYASTASTALLQSSSRDSFVGS